MQTMTLSGALYAGMISGGADHLGCYRKAVNDLNVFPIPDGDTGDNMLATVYSGADAVERDTEADLATVADRSAHGMLLGARGNSGVILSRIFSGINKGFAGVREANLAVISHAMECGVEEAYRAVPVPVEGTILTVFSDGVRYANGRIADDSTLETYFTDLLGEMQRSLERTPELLPVLREAGVVDSGGAGLIYIFEGMLRSLAGETVERAEVRTETKKADLDAFGADSVLEYGYCTEFLLRLQNAKGDPEAFDLPAFVEYLNSVGNSVVAFREGSILKVHVHTMRPGDILNRCQRYGEFLTLKVENMSLQHNETELPEVTVTAPKPRKKAGIVAVAAGAGLKETFLELGTDVVIDGGQSMNPSTADFLDAFDRTNADVIYVFPNNGNVLMTAKQAKDLYPASDIRVLNTHTVGEGYAAISMMDPDAGEPDEVVSELDEIIRSITTGFVSRASRNAEKDGVHVREGDFIGFIGDTIYVNDCDAVDTAMQLSKEMHVENCGVLLLLVGQDAPKPEADALFAALTKSYPRTEVIRIDGGQPVHQYILVGE
ncbi:MAG: DAK2 domain-containing protein [Clostridia bacterium]|nr:DAK2 domain-containing protein [Clostridia bacterium]